MSFKKGCKGSNCKGGGFKEAFKNAKGKKGKGKDTSEDVPAPTEKMQKKLKLKAKK